MRPLALALILLCGALGAAALAEAEIEQGGGVRLSFGGHLAPHALPRQREAPVSLDLEGSIGGVEGKRPPQLRRFSLAINRYGHLFAAGLPTCRTAELEQTSTREALARCRGALVGQGSFTAQVELANTSAFPERGRALAFNGREGGRPVVVLQIYGARPVEATVVLVFRISHPAGGRFGTVFSTTVPRIASDLGYLTEMQMSFARRYRYRGEERSFLSARCAAPAGFGGAVFALARGRFAFANGRQLTMTLTRECAVR